MRFEPTSTGELQLVDVADDAILADSQLDYPASGRGWRFGATNKDNSVAELVPRPVDPALTTRNLFRIGSNDPYCRLGRDNFHPGYEQTPTLSWTADRDRHVVLSIEAAVIGAGAKSRARASALLDGVTLWTDSFLFPEVLRGRLAFNARAGQTVHIRLGADRFIDHLTGIYYCWLVEDGDFRPGLSNPVTSVTSAATLDPSWASLYSRIAATSGCAATEAKDVAHHLFDHRYDQSAAIDRLYIEAYGGPAKASGLGTSRFFQSVEGIKE